MSAFAGAPNIPNGSSRPLTNCAKSSLGFDQTESRKWLYVVPGFPTR
jgi:hypothetical protein